MEERYVFFRSRLHAFLVPLRQTARVVPWQPPRPLPLVPPHIVGVIHFEGSLWVVVDLDVIAGDEPATGGEFLLVRAAGSRLALRAQRVHDILVVDESRRDHRPAPGLPETCTRFSTVLGGMLAYALELDAFIEEYRVR